MEEPGEQRNKVVQSVERGSGHSARNEKKIHVYSCGVYADANSTNCQQEWKASSAVTVINGARLHRTRQLKSIQVEHSRNKDILMILVFFFQNYMFAMEKKIAEEITNTSYRWEFRQILMHNSQILVIVFAIKVILTALTILLIMIITMPVNK